MRRFVFFLFISCLIGCKKKESEQPNPPAIIPGAVSGSVILPAGSTVNTAGWKVNSGFAETQVSGNKFNLSKASNDYGILFVSDQNGTERLMGLVYEGQTNFVINSESTVLAMLMKMPAVSSLNSEGKLNLLKSITKNPAFAGTVQEFETAFLQNKSLFDSTNSIFLAKLVNLFEKAASKITDNRPNVNIVRAGRTIAFQNPGWAFSQSIGVYKNGSRVKSMILDRYQWYASSIPEIITAIGNPPNPIEQIYTMEGDGDYEFRVRTGRPFSGVTGPEADEAFIDNYTNLIFDNISAVIKNIPFVDFNNKCVKEMRSFTAGQVAGYVSLLGQSNGSPATISPILLQITLSTVDLAISSTECLSAAEAKGFFAKAKQLMKFVNLVSYTGQLLNTTLFVKNYTEVPAAFDTCFSVSGNTVSSNCKLSLKGWYKGTYTTKSAGNRCDFYLNKTGLFYMYINSNNESVVYVKSIFEEIPNILDDKALVQYVSVSSLGKEYYQFLHREQVNNKYGLKCGIELEVGVITMNRNIEQFGKNGGNLLTGWTFSRAPLGTGKCITNNDYDVDYRLDYSGSFIDVKIPPSDLTSQEIAAILEKAK